MLKTKGRPATADALHRADAPPGRRGDKNSSNLSRSTTAAVTGRPAARMFRPAADSPSPSRNKARKGSPDRSPARHSAAEQGQQAAVAAAGAGVGKNMTVVVAGKGSEVRTYCCTHIPTHRWWVVDCLLVRLCVSCFFV